MARKKRKTGINPRYAHIRYIKGMEGDLAKYRGSVPDTEEKRRGKRWTMADEYGKRRKMSGPLEFRTAILRMIGLRSYLLLLFKRNFNVMLGRGRRASYAENSCFARLRLYTLPRRGGGAAYICPIESLFVFFSRPDVATLGAPLLSNARRP